MKAFEQIINKVRGRNSFSELTTLAPGDFRSVKNIDLFDGPVNDYFKCRRGSRQLAPVDPESYSVPFFNKTVYALGDSEYLIANVNVGFTSQALFPIENPIPLYSSVLTASETGSSNIINIVLDGLTLSNTDNWTLFGDVTLSAGPTYTLDLYEDAEKLSLVAQLVATANGQNMVVEQNSSGISGTAFIIDITSGASTDLNIRYMLWDQSSVPHDMKNANQKVYCFSQSGNKVIEYKASETRFTVRPMGLTAPIISAAEPFNIMVTANMPLTGLWFYGLEKVYRVNGADIVASSPHRRFLNGTMNAVSPNDTGAILLTIDPDELEDDPYWTHIRGWRSKNTVTDISDPLFPIDAQGTADQLYEFALITREEIFGTFGAVDTGPDLPPGNVNVNAGLSSGDYLISDNNPDSMLINFIDLDLIDLIPIPPSRTGAVHAGRVFVSGINESDIDSDLIEDVLYSNQQFTAYAEQWDPQAYLNAGRNSFKTTMLYSFNDDLLIIREGETKRIPSGNVDAGIQMVDDRIGAKTFRMCGFITGLGIAAICGDKYFRYLGFDYKWHSNIGSIEISQSIFDLTSNETATVASFIYINGKLILLITNGDYGTTSAMAALHIKEGKGWTEYEYPGDEIGHTGPFSSAFTFSDGERAALVGYGSTLLEIEFDSDTDQTIFTGEDFPTPTKVLSSFEGATFMSKDGMIDVTRYSFFGKLSQASYVTAKSSNNTWQMKSTFQDPGLWESNPTLNEREYRFEPEPQTVGTFKWVPLRGQFISFVFETSGAFMMSWQKVTGLLRGTKGNLGVYQTGGIIPQGPGWANSSLFLLNFEDPGDTFYDASGHGINHTWSAGIGVIREPLEVTASGSAFLSDLDIDFPSDPVQTYFRITRDGLDSPNVQIIAYASESDRTGDTNRIMAGGDDYVRMPTTVNLLEENGSGFSGSVFVDITADGDEILCQLVTESVSKTNRVTQKPGKGVSFTPTGTISYPTDQSSILMGSSNLTWKIVFSFSDDGKFVSSGKSGPYSWRFQVSESVFRFDIDANGTSYNYQAASFSPSSDTVYVMAFFLKRDFTGQFFVDAIDASSFYGARPTVRAVPSDIPTISTGHVISSEGIYSSVVIPSYYSIEKTDIYVEQAKRFWGTMKVY